MITAIKTFLSGFTGNAIFYGLIAIGISASVATGFVAYRGALSDADERGYSRATAEWKAQLAESEAKVQAERAEREKISAQLNSVLNQTINMVKDNERATDEQAKKLSDGNVLALPLSWLRLSE
jgi:hypothetical protein